MVERRDLSVAEIAADIALRCDGQVDPAYSEMRIMTEARMRFRD
jgi:hypothetical protein